MPKLKKPQTQENEEGESMEGYESFDEGMEIALSEDALDGIMGSDDDFDPEAALGLDFEAGSDSI